jgi:hypothetical protein
LDAAINTLVEESEEHEAKARGMARQDAKNSVKR